MAMELFLRVGIREKAGKFICFEGGQLDLVKIKLAPKRFSRLRDIMVSQDKMDWSSVTLGRSPMCPALFGPTAQSLGCNVKWGPLHAIFFWCY